MCASGLRRRESASFPPAPRRHREFFSVRLFSWFWTRLAAQHAASRRSTASLHPECARGLAECLSRRHIACNHRARPGEQLSQARAECRRERVQIPDRCLRCAPSTAAVPARAGRSRGWLRDRRNRSTFDQPRRMRRCQREFRGIFLERVNSQGFSAETIAARGRCAQDRIHHARGKPMPGLLGQLHALVDRRMRRNAIEKPEAETRPGAAAISTSASSFAFGRLSSGRRFVVEPDLPAQHAEHQRRGQVAVGGRKRSQHSARAADRRNGRGRARPRAEFERPLCAPEKS